jgi:hypothetical protein
MRDIVLGVAIWSLILEAELENALSINVPKLSAMD